MNPRAWVARARRITFVLAALGGLYLYLRVEFLTLPADGCSPLYGIDPGAPLLLDRRPSQIGPGDAVLFRGPGGQLHLARVVEPPGDLRADWRAAQRAGSLWLVTEREDCPGADSRELGPVELERIVAEVVAVLPRWGGGS